MPNLTGKRTVAQQDMGAVGRRQGNKMMEAQYGAPGPINQSRPNQDPQNQTAASLLSFNSTARVLIGQITDCTSLAHVYRVQFEKTVQPMVATFLPRSCCASTGPKELTTLQVGTPVVCVVHDQLPWAAILNALPLPGTDARKSVQGIIAGSTRARVDDAHKRPFSMPTTNNVNGGIPDLLSGRPYDALCGGEVGWISELGMKFFQDQWMTLLGVDESCGISFFYHDSLARIAAYNMQMWTAVRECESYNDQDECQDWTGYAGYPWEQMGRLDRTNPAVIKTPEEWQVQEPWYGKIEPEDDWTMPWHREREFHGYFGQGGKRLTQAPPTDSGDHVCYKGGDGIAGAKHPGLSDDFTTQDGRRCIASAKGISIVKRCVIIAPTRLRRPEQPKTGDTETNYMASSKQGAGPEHKITGDIETNGNSQFNRAMGILDMHAYFFNYAGLHPFFYHDKDYKVWQEAEADWADGKSEESPSFSELAGSMYITPDQFKKTINIDHRYGDQDFYTVSCGLELLDDGGVLLYGGLGEELRLAGGHAILSSPGDTWLKSGRNVNVWAGYDFCARAKNSWDITATQHDGRLKAEGNLQVLAGNGGVGGVLIESRAKGAVYEFDECGQLVVSSGVMLRAPDSEIVNWGMNIYMRTGGGNVKRGVIMLDSAKGERDIITQQRNQMNFIKSSAFFHFMSGEEGEVEKTSMLSKSNTVLCSNACIDGHMILAKDVIMKGNILVAKGHIFTERAKTTMFVLPLTDPGLSDVYEAVAQCQEVAEQTLPEAGTEYWTDVLDPLFYAEQRPGNDDTIEKAEFSLRTLVDYRTEDFKIYEDRWQQMGRIAKTATQTWRERPVKCQGDDTYPYPGKENFTGDRLHQQPLTMFDVQQGRAKSRGNQPELADRYADPKFGAQTAVPLNKYLVIR